MQKVYGAVTFPWRQLWSRAQANHKGVEKYIFAFFSWWMLSKMRAIMQAHVGFICSLWIGCCCLSWECLMFINQRQHTRVQLFTPQQKQFGGAYAFLRTITLETNHQCRQSWAKTYFSSYSSFKWSVDVIQHTACCILHLVLLYQNLLPDPSLPGEGIRTLRWNDRFELGLQSRGQSVDSNCNRIEYCCG